MVLVSSAGFAVGCGPAPPSPPPVEKGHVWYVSPRVLFESHLFDPGRYKDQRVRVELPPGTYGIAGGRVRWNAANPDDFPSIVFEGTPVPSDNTKLIVAEGVCRGRVFDGGERASKITWHVRVTECSLEAARDK